MAATRSSHGASAFRRFHRAELVGAMGPSYKSLVAEKLLD
jgi:hypothetical protein